MYFSLFQHIRLVEVTSNIWGTKFKIHGLAASVPANLGQVTYKTSLLHLQPRQMTLVITELRDDFPPGPDPNFNPNLFSEDEDESGLQDEHTRLHPGLQTDIAPPIAPMTPRSHHTTGGLNGRFVQNRPKTQVQTTFVTSECLTRPIQSQENSGVVGTSSVPALARAESYEDEFPYVELTDVVSYCESIRTSATSSVTSTSAKTFSDSCSCPQVISVPNSSVYTGNGPYTSIVACNSSNSYNVGTMSQFTRSNMPSSAQSSQTRHVISPLVCEGAVPALQSPKNTVAPSEIIIERTSSTHTLMASPPSDYSSNMQRVKSALADQNQNKNSGSMNLNLNLGSIEQSGTDIRPLVMKRIDIEANNKLHHVMNGNDASNSDISLFTQHSPSHLTSPLKGAVNNNTINSTKRKGSNKSSPIGNQVGIAAKWCVTKPEELLYIDEDGSGDITPEKGVKRTPTIMSISPYAANCLADSMVRSCSVGYLDLVDAQMVPCEVALLMLRKETPKRLVLVNRKKQRKQKHKTQHSQESNSKQSPTSYKAPKLKHCGKSKSLDSSDIFTSSSTNESSYTKKFPSQKEKENQNMKQHESTVGTVTSSAETTTTNTANHVSINNIQAFDAHKNNPANKQIPAEHVADYNFNVLSLNDKVISKPSQISTKYLDSGVSETLREKLLGKDNSSPSPRGAVSSAGLAALESLTSRIRELDETHSLPPPSPCSSPRMPRSSPASPAPSKKSKRNQSSSPIR